MLNPLTSPIAVLLILVGLDLAANLAVCERDGVDLGVGCAIAESPHGRPQVVRVNALYVMLRPPSRYDANRAALPIEDPALDALALIVLGADTARLGLTRQSPGLLAVSLGLSAIFADDHAMIERGMTVYDALYAWCRDCRDQGHDWNPATIAARA